MAILAAKIAEESGYDPKEAAWLALFHDIEEIQTGDIPSTQKERMEMGHHEYKGADPGIAQIVKSADLLETFHWIAENGVGRHAEQVIKSCEKIITGFFLHGFITGFLKNPVMILLQDSGIL